LLFSLVASGQINVATYRWLADPQASGRCHRADALS
jgi:hypothetical protein